jgi:hypothetical protein
MSADKMNTSEVFEMFETINNKLDKRQTDKSAEPTQIDTTAINTMTEQFEIIIAEVRKPVKVEHRHTIDIGSGTSGKNRESETECRGIREIAEAERNDKTTE